MDLNRFLGLIFLFVVFPCWVAMMLSAFHFRLRVAPRALEEWLESGGMRLERKRERLYFWGNPFSRDATSTRMIYRIEALEPEGKKRGGWVQIGGGRFWPLSARRCPIEVRWDDGKAVNGKGVDDQALA